MQTNIDSKIEQYSNKIELNVDLVILLSYNAWQI